MQPNHASLVPSPQSRLGIPSRRLLCRVVQYLAKTTFRTSITFEGTGGDALSKTFSAVARSFSLSFLLHLPLRFSNMAGGRSGHETILELAEEAKFGVVADRSQNRP